MVTRITRPRRFLPDLPDALGIAGVVSLVWGVRLWWPPAAFMVAGACGIVAAVLLSRAGRRRREG